MWKTFENNKNLYMIKVEQEENLIVYLSDLLAIWSQNISKEFVLNQFQEANPLFDVKIDEAVTQVVNLINNISDTENTEVTNTSADTIHLALTSTKDEVDIKFSFDLEKLTPENFLKEITVPLIQTVRHLEEQQKILCNLIAKKDRELEEYKLEKGDISREDLMSERFDEDSVKSVDKRSMMGVFGSSKSFWDTFIEQFGDITATIEDVQKDPWNHIQRKRKVYSSKTAVKKEISMGDSDSAPSDIDETDPIVVPSLLPEKSRAKYELTYERFKKWCIENDIENGTNEKGLLAYFEYLSKVRKPTSLWVYYWILRTVISAKENLDISKYSKLIAFLKLKSEGYLPRKSKILTKQDVAKFLQDADDETFLLIKVALIVGLGGACRRDELAYLRIDNIKDEGDYLHFTIPTTETKISREFFITVGDIDGINMMEIIRKYIRLRPDHTDHRRFFIGYRSGKCSTQPVGVNTFRSMPKTIASFLKLPNPEEYVGDCFRRSSDSLLADHVTIKRHGGWQSNTVIEGSQDIDFEECNLEQDVTFREDGSVEPFDEDSMMEVVFENSESSWDRFSEHEDMKVSIEDFENDPWNHIEEAAEVDSPEIVVKQEISLDESDSASSDIEEVESNVVPSLVPEKSKAKYELTYKRFTKWCEEQNFNNGPSEEVLLAYFESLSQAWKPSSLWASYSMLRAMLSVKENLDIRKYTNLVAFLRRKSKGYRPKKSKILTKQDVARFLQEADDDTFLLVKVALIIGLGGACRREELTNLLLENVKDETEYLHFTIPTTQNKVSREFFITVGDIRGINMMELIRKYISLRPAHTDHQRFFIGYRKGKCTIQPVGINTFGSMPKTIALFLKLPNPEDYAGSCFRRSSASLLDDLVTIKRHGGWQSNTVVGGQNVELEGCSNLEKGDISREDLSTEKFDEDSVINVNENPMMDIFDNSESFWGTFIEQNGDVKVSVENVQKESSNTSQNREMDSSETLLKKETCMGDSYGVLSGIEEIETIDVSSVLPEKSKAKYELSYERFNKWCDEKGIKNGTSEKVLLTYFESLSKAWKPSSLWTSYSMLRAMMSVKQNLDISKYTRLMAFLKQKSEGYRPKKSKILTKQDVAKFLQEADDYTFLLLKVALIIGIGGACKREELTNLRIDNVKDEKDYLHFTIPTSRKKVSREFFITVGDIDGINMMELIRKYISLRPAHTDHRRFFIGYRKGRCTVQPVGINTFGSMPKTIASVLNLPNPQEYSGNCFKRSSASLLADFVTKIKRHGGWQSIEGPQPKIKKEF